MNRQNLIYLAAGIAAILVMFSVLKQESPSPNENSEKIIETAETSSAPTPKMQINATKTYTATLTTSEGDITIELFTDKIPITVNNFVSLAKKNFYDNTIFHRVISGFMIQGGDPKGDGTGGPGYTFADEKFEGEYTRGTVAMANAGPDTNGSQFFIMHEDNLTMPKNYVIFGQVTNGMDVVDKIATSEVGTNASGEMSKPINPVKIKSVKIEEK